MPSARSPPTDVTASVWLLRFPAKLRGEAWLELRPQYVYCIRCSGTLGGAIYHHRNLTPNKRRRLHSVIDEFSQ